MIEIVIDLEPITWMAPRGSRHRMYNPRDKDKRATRYLITEQYKGPIIDSLVDLYFVFEFAYPKNASAKKRQQMLFGKIAPLKKDISNMIKFYEDCLKGIVIKDDRLVTSITANKCYSDRSCIIILIDKLNENKY